MAALEPTLRDEIDALYGAHHQWLFAWLRKRLGCEHHAADVAQDTFMRILGSSQSLLGINEPRAYLTTTAKRLLIDQARRKAIEEAYLAELALWLQEEDFHPSAEQSMLVLEMLTMVGAALQPFSSRVQEAFLLHYFHGETHSAVAARLGVSTKSVQKYLIQALVALHQLRGELSSGD